VEAARANPHEVVCIRPAAAHGASHPACNPITSPATAIWGRLPWIIREKSGTSPTSCARQAARARSEARGGAPNRTFGPVWGGRRRPGVCSEPLPMWQVRSHAAPACGVV